MTHDQETDAPAAPAALPDGEYAIVELLGHRTLVGRIVEVERFGSKLLQIEPIFAGRLLEPVYHHGSALYGLTPCTAAVAEKRAPQNDWSLPAPIRAWLEPLQITGPDATSDLRWEDAYEECCDMRTDTESTVDALTEAVAHPMRNLIAKLEAATEGSRELDAEIWALEPCVEPDCLPDVKMRVIERMLGGGDDSECPHYTTSLDAALPGEDIVFMRLIHDGKGRWYEAQQSGSYSWTGKHKSEALARRIAALKARMADDA